MDNACIPSRSWRRCLITDELCSKEKFTKNYVTFVIEFSTLFSKERMSAAKRYWTTIVVGNDYRFEQ